MGRTISNPQVLAASTFVLTGTFLHNFTTWTNGDVTPSVSGGYAFKTANSALTTITNFDDPPAAGGQSIKIIFGDTKTRIAHNANIKLQGAGGIDGYFGNSQVGDVIWFTYDGRVWWEDTRSVNS